MAGGGRIKHNGNDWKIQSYKGTNLGYDMLFDSVNSNQEEKEGDLLDNNRVISLKNLIINIDNFLVCKECAQERGLQIKLAEKRDVEKFIDYVEAYFQLTPSDEQKGIRELHEDLNKQTYNRQQLLIRIRSEYLSPSTAMVYLPPLRSLVTVKNKINTSTTIILLFIFLRKTNIILLSPATLHSYGTQLNFNGSSGCN